MKDKSKHDQNSITSTADSIDPSSLIPHPSSLLTNPSSLPDRLSRLLVIVFVVLFLGWTVALLVPIPGQAVELLGGQDNAFYFGKLLHCGVYTVLTLLACFLPLSSRGRIALIVTLLAHGWITEYFQQFVQRGSSVRDAIIDNVGVLLGLALRWGYLRLKG